MEEPFPLVEPTAIQGLLNALPAEEKTQDIPFGGAAAQIGKNGSIRLREVLVYLNGDVDRFYLQLGDVAQA